MVLAQILVWFGLRGTHNHWFEFWIGSPQRGSKGEALPKTQNISILVWFGLRGTHNHWFEFLLGSPQRGSKGKPPPNISIPICSVFKGITIDLTPNWKPSKGFKGKALPKTQKISIPIWFVFRGVAIRFDYQLKALKGVQRGKPCPKHRTFRYWFDLVWGEHTTIDLNFLLAALKVVQKGSKECQNVPRWFWHGSK